jgi:hypothetical protein
MRDDFTNLPGFHQVSEFDSLCGDQVPSDTSLTAAQIIEEIGWLEPEIITSLLKGEGISPFEPEAGAEADLDELLTLGRVRFPERGTLSVNWGDGTEPEKFGAGHKKLKAGHTHFFARSGQYQVLIVTKGPSAPPEFCRLILQVRCNLGEIDALHSIGMQ